jgi:hypothetical protein
MSEDKKPKISIAWGTEREQAKTYVFENETQKAFFMKGVDEAVGWLQYDEIQLGHETISYEQTSEPKNRLEQMAQLSDDAVAPE